MKSCCAALRILAARLGASVLILWLGPGIQDRASVSAAWAAAPPALVAMQESFAAIAAKAKPSVVHITTVHEEVVRLPQFFFGDPEDFFHEFFYGKPRTPYVQRFRTQGSGSGFIFDAAGYVLTNEHVVRGADEIRVIQTLPSGKERSYPARVIGKDPYLDLAVVKIQGAGPFPALTLGDSDKVRVGDWAMAIGSPFALGQTVTVGIISASSRPTRRSTGATPAVPSSIWTARSSGSTPPFIPPPEPSPESGLPFPSARPRRLW